jgi:hypothetical protein
LIDHAKVVDEQGNVVDLSLPESDVPNPDPQEPEE